MFDSLLNMSNEELREWFNNEVIMGEPDPEFHRICIEYHRNIENDFEKKWSQKKFKWFAKRYRQNKLMTEIYRRYRNPVFYLIEKTIEETLPNITDDFFNCFVDFKNVAKENHNEIN